MPTPSYDVPAGAIDGVNKTYTLPVPYIASTLVVFVNGQLRKQDLPDGWLETSPSTGVLDLKEALLPGDVIQVYYLSANDTGSPLVVEVVLLQGRITDETSLYGSFAEDDALVGILT